MSEERRMKKSDIPYMLSVRYGVPGKIVIRRGCQEIMLDMELETPIVEIVNEFNDMVEALDNICDGEDKGIREQIERVLEGVNDDSISSIQDALSEIEYIVRN